MNTFYFDNSATTKPCKYAADAMLEATTMYGNPSSLHSLGFDAEKIMRAARKNISDILNTSEKNICFTSGGTEANNLAIFGTAYRRRALGKHLITLKTEHPSVLNAYKCLEKEGWGVTYINVDKNGILDMEQLENSISKQTVLVSLAHVNNEIGTIQPINEIGALIKKINPKCYFHVDCVQSFMKIPIDLKGAGVSLASFSAHKIHSFKGAGALYIADGILIDSILYGGGQEGNLRSGTENTGGIAAFGKAASWCNTLNNNGALEEIKTISCYIRDQLNKENFTFMCDENVSAPHIISVSVKNVRGEVLLHTLEKKGIYVSTGSACSSHKRSMSHVLQAIGTSAQTAQGVIRISLGHMNTMDEAKYMVDELKKCVEQLQNFN